VPYKSTHHTQFSSILLDLFIVVDKGKLNYGQWDVCFLSIHNLIDITYKVKITYHPQRCKFRSFDSEHFLQDLETFDWVSVYCATDIDRKVELFNNLLVDCYDKYALFKIIKSKHLPALFLSNHH